ncbi:hypothetical protein [Lysinibacillus varians]|uniref:Uncharacterized protein n=1 Tax=Lysinibacillus varians TaxID=1145276 RepID=A0ABY2TB65_9BACI|nr:hypothetical protein [Lysinibacillus varians]AHN24223.1 hypothetical protein T479_12085 [Lysinibacillus varians]TKI52685.1 hypothetical protein FC752_19070 [Lysinibacillus varians]
MKLKQLEESTHQSSGYGAGSGEVINETYECPCGNGKVFYEKDDIPGFRSSDIWSNCKECDEKYTFGRGIATEK